MTISTSISRSISFVLALFLVVAAPAHALASVQITEIFYDAPGSDQGHEWIEIANTDTVPADLSGWRLAQGGTNHILSVIHGTTTLAAGEVAIIAADPETFLTDYPAYTAALFKSAFSLTNTGETIALKNKALAVEDSVSYRAADGAAGDGNSLHINGTSLLPGAPNPGSLAVTKAIVKAAAVSVASASAAKTGNAGTAAKKSKSTSSAKKIYAGVDQSAALPFTLPRLPGLSLSWIYGFGMLALLCAGGAAFWYARARDFGFATNTETDEFELE